MVYDVAYAWRFGVEGKGCGSCVAAADEGGEMISAFQWYLSMFCAMSVDL